ncbi:MAG: CotH kinase family protein [Muribaculaceae bacterium]|nr:CotH kinase family protein [Muribaculaceae bacterium]
MKKILMFLVMAFVAMGASAQSFPNFYIRGDFSNDGWGVHEEYKFQRDGSEYSIKVPSLNGQFKISNEDWTINFGSSTGAKETISRGGMVEGKSNGPNFIANNLHNVEISFSYAPGDETTWLIVRVTVGLEWNTTLPVLHINVKNDNGFFNNEIIDKDLSHKNYFAGEYWLDLNGCEWMEAEGAKSIGSRDEPLPLEIKARGNYTRTAFAKKPFKLKLGAKQKLLGLTKSKHFALLAHADDNMGYLRNFAGFNLGKRIGLPWTPAMQPCEVIINGDYRGLYFLTESIRVDGDRVNIEELDDNVSDQAMISGGYIVELDNYDEDNQIRMEEKGKYPGYKDMLRVTFDTPEMYSDLQYRFVKDQFTAINDLIGADSDDMWKYLDMDDLARYYIVEELISHTEAFHGSTYLFRDRGEGQKWHFSPLWDCGNAFNGRTNDWFYHGSPYGNTWIGSLCMNATFMEKVRETWLWFMSNNYDGINEDIDTFADHIRQAAITDHARWKNEPQPSNTSVSLPVSDNSDMTAKSSHVKSHIWNKQLWLRDQFGDFTGKVYPEPTRDTTPAAPLPSYVAASIGEITDAADGEIVEIFDLRGFKVADMRSGQVYIVRYGNGEYRKIMK